MAAIAAQKIRIRLKAYDHDAIDRAAKKRGGFGGRRDDLSRAADFRSAGILGFRVPAGAGVFAGRRYAELPDPFSPLFEVVRCGFVVLSMDERGITLLEAAS